MKRVILHIALLLIATPACSGAWLREKDSAFVAAAVTAFKDSDGRYDYKSSLYAEWGYRPNLTIGFDFEEHRDV